MNQILHAIDVRLSAQALPWSHPNAEACTKSTMIKQPQESCLQTWKSRRASGTKGQANSKAWEKLWREKSDWRGLGFKCWLLRFKPKTILPNHNWGARKLHKKKQKAEARLITCWSRRTSRKRCRHCCNTQLVFATLKRNESAREHQIQLGTINGTINGPSWERHTWNGISTWARRRSLGFIKSFRSWLDFTSLTLERFPCFFQTARHVLSRESKWKKENP